MLCATVWHKVAPYFFFGGPLPVISALPIFLMPHNKQCVMRAPGQVRSRVWLCASIDTHRLAWPCPPQTLLTGFD